MLTNHCAATQVPAKVLEQVLAHGRLLMYRSGRQIHESAPVRAGLMQAWSCCLHLMTSSAGQLAFKLFTVCTAIIPCSCSLHSGLQCCTWDVVALIPCAQHNWTIICKAFDELLCCIAQDEGIFIVCSGLVRVRYDVWQGTSQTYFLGTGGMFGLFSALTGKALFQALLFVQGISP